MAGRTLFNGKYFRSCIMAGRRLCTTGRMAAIGESGQEIDVLVAIQEGDRSNLLALAAAFGRIQRLVMSNRKLPVRPDLR